MNVDNTTAVIGAGPYGLSAAAYLKGRGLPTLIFGKPMEFWKKMPNGINLKSVVAASTIYDPAGEYSLRRYYQTHGLPAQDPIPLQTFLKYGDWFQQNAVSDVDTTYVEKLTRDGKHFVLDMADGRTIHVKRVVVATGIACFAYVPEYARNLPLHLASHTQYHSDFAQFNGKNVVVVGSGQSALESSALLHEAGANVEVITRGDVIWINRALYDKTGPAKHIFYPSSDVGPPGLNWLIAFPLLFRRLSDETRYMVDRRAIRPSGAKWLRPRVEGHVTLTENTQVVKATPKDDLLHLELSDGTTREIHHLILGTGYEPSVEKVDFLAPELVQQIQTARKGYPVLNKWFESSVSGLYFVGALAGNNFGPLCRFVAGAKVPAQQIVRHAARVA